MSDHLSRWNDDLIRQGKSEAEIEQAQREQERIQASLTDIFEEEAQLVSLLRMGVHFSLEQQPIVHTQLILLSLIQFALSQLPRLFIRPFDDAALALYGLNISFLIFPFLAIYRGRGQKRLLAAYLLSTALLALLVNVLFLGKVHTQEPTLVLAILHLPLFFILTMALFERQHSLVKKLCKHLSLVGETLLLSFLLACATAVSMLLAILLFEAIGWRIEEDVATVVLTGIIPLLPLLSLHLLTTKAAKLQQLTRLLSTLFLPVFTTLMALFLLALLFTKAEVVQDRSLLLVIDVLLAILLLMILTAADLLELDQWSRGWRRLIILSCSVALALDIVALRAIGMRLAQYGLTPNRLAVLAQNILLCANLLALVTALLRRRSPSRLQARFLLLYGAWFLVVVLIFPLLF